MCPSQLVTHTTNPTQHHHTTRNKTPTHQHTRPTTAHDTKTTHTATHRCSRPTMQISNNRPTQHTDHTDARVHYPDLKQQPHTTPTHTPPPGTTGHSQAPKHRSTGLIPQDPNSVPTPHPPRPPHQVPHPPGTRAQTQQTGSSTEATTTTHEAVHSSTIPLVNTTMLPATRRRHGGRSGCVLLRKEVIQPHLPVRLPCYDFVPIASPTFDHSLPQAVGPWASGVADFRDVTGGVYKARERIHRSVADLRLLATPTSWGRVADPNPN